MGSQKKGTPLDSFNLADEYQEGFDEAGKFPDRLERYGNAKSVALINLAQIDLTLKTITNHDSLRFRLLSKVRSRLVVCGSFLAFKDYYTIGKIRLSAANFCMKHLLCPLCAIRRGAKALEAYMKRYYIIMAEHPYLRLSMLTITIKNGDDLQERFKHLKKSLSLMLEWRRKTLSGKAGYHSEFAKIWGGVGSIEVTKDNGYGDIKETGWHVHAHFNVLHSDNFDYVELQAEWLRITGDSHVLRVDAAQHPEDPAQDFMEVFKYTVKFSDLTPEENLEVFEVMRNTRLIIPFGVFYGVDVPEDLTDEDFLTDLPYIERFYQYLTKSGYNLTKIREYDPKKDDISQEDWQVLPSRF